MVAKSTIPGAGDGLFCMEHVEAGDVVARYSGQPLTQGQAEARDSAYILKVSSKLYLDASEPDNWEGRYINDGPRSGREPNCIFAAAYNTNAMPMPGSDRRWIKVFALRAIRPGEELLMAYGDGYWDTHARPPGEAAHQYMNAPIPAAHNGGSNKYTTNEHVRSASSLDLMSAINSQLPDGLAYIGSAAFEHVLSCEFFFNEADEDSYVTTAALRRSGNHPKDRQHPPQTPADTHALPGTHLAAAPLQQWLRGREPAHSLLHAGRSVLLDKLVILQPGKPRADLNDVPMTIVAGNDMRCIIGRRLWRRICSLAEKTTSPLDQYDDDECTAEAQGALEDLQAKVEQVADLSAQLKAQTRFLLFESCAPLWRAKFDLQEPCYLPPMRIQIKPGAEPTRIKRHYRWMDAQAKFLEKHLVKLVNIGIISHTESPWLCPIVLPKKTDGT